MNAARIRATAVAAIVGAPLAAAVLASPAHAAIIRFSRRRGEEEAEVRQEEA